MIKKDGVAEKIMRVKNALRTSEEMARLSKEHNINEGAVIILEDKINFERKMLANYRISMVVPNTLEEMDQASAEIKYQDSRPEYIYISENALIHISFSVEKLDDKEFDTTKIKDELIDEMKEEVPESPIIANGVLTASLDNEQGQAGDINVPYFSFDRKAVDGTAHNIIFLLPVDNRLVIGAITFNSDNMDEIEPIAMQMLESIQIMPKNKRGR